MRILLLTPLFPPDKGGASLDFDYLSRIFSQNENVSDILVVSGWKKGKKLCRVNGKITNIKILNYGNCQNPVYRLIWNTLIIREIVAGYRPHIIIFHSVILPSREYYHEVFRNIGDAKLYLYKTDLFPVPGFSRLNGIIYLSNNIGKWLRQQMKIPAEKLIYIPLLFKPPRHGSGKRAEAVYPFRYILYIGPADPLKGLHQLIKAFYMLIKAHGNVKLIVIGAGGSGISYHPGILFLNEQGRTGVYEHIKNAAVVVIPSYSEGLPRVALETLYLKKPLIITRVVEETGHLYPHQILEGNEPEEIARKIEGILKGEPYKTEFDWDALRLDRSRETWNKLIDGTAGDVSRTGTLDFSALVKEMDPLAKKCYTAVMTSRDFFHIPREVLNLLPGLETIPHIYLLKTPDEKNREPLIHKVYNNPLLMNHEKKEIIKALLDRALERFHTGMESGKICRMFDSLVPLTAEDFLYLGTYFMKRKEFKAAAQLFYRGLDHLPEITHFKLFYHLLASIPPEFRGNEQEALVKRFKNYLRRIPFSDLVTGLDNKTMGFLEFYMDVNDKKVYETLGKKRNKTQLDMYRLASFYKRQGDYRRAVRGFERVAGNGCDVGLSAGACFHLGEMAFERKRYPGARKHFEACLQLNPSHGKAGEYLRRMDALDD